MFNYDKFLNRVIKVSYASMTFINKDEDKKVFKLLKLLTKTPYKNVNKYFNDQCYILKIEPNTYNRYATIHNLRLIINQALTIKDNRKHKKLCNKYLKLRNNILNKSLHFKDEKIINKYMLRVDLIESFNKNILKIA